MRWVRAAVFRACCALAFWAGRLTSPDPDVATSQAGAAPFADRRADTGRPPAERR